MLCKLLRQALYWREDPTPADILKAAYKVESKPKEAAAQGPEEIVFGPEFNLPPEEYAKFLAMKAAGGRKNPG